MKRAATAILRRKFHRNGRCISHIMFLLNRSDDRVDFKERKNASLVSYSFFLFQLIRSNLELVEAFGSTASMQMQRIDGIRPRFRCAR